MSWLTSESLVPLQRTWRDREDPLLATADTRSGAVRGSMAGFEFFISGVFHFAQHRSCLGEPVFSSSVLSGNGPSRPQ
jgi:hypothetical protein